ncbi:MAG TPA: PAS domain S-box protein [Pyrinomonadaceae bacterium]
MSLDPPEPAAPEELTPEEWVARLKSPELSPYWLSALVESAEDAIVTKTLDGRITSWNRGAERVFGYTAAEAVGRPVTMLIPEDHLDEEPAILSRIRAGERVEHYETVRVRKDGSLVDISLTVSPIRGADGRVVGASKIARDITDRKLAERELERLLESERRARHEAEGARREAEEASRLKDEFLATVSHELRTPLTAILGWAHMLRTGQLVGPDARGVYETIERNARAQSQLIDDLLDVSRIITGKLRIDVRRVDPVYFIDSAVEAVRPAADGKGVRLHKETEAGTAWVAGDPVRLQQVVWNLLSNAMKFTPRGGSVEVRLARNGANVEISVKDTGAGIAPEFLPHVFERFRQAEGGITRQHGGLGLGLSIVRHLVELHGGGVSAESPGEGQGSTFTVSLPAAPARKGEDVGAASTAPPAYGCPERLDGLRVLIVDDEPDTLMMLKVGLSLCGAEVETASAVAGALAALDAGRFDVLITDIGMPGEDGYDLIREVRSRPADGGGRIPAVALTAYARVEDRLQALRSGFQMHVPKPVELAELVAVTSSLVGREG